MKPKRHKIQILKIHFTLFYSTTGSCLLYLPSAPLTSPYLYNMEIGYSNFYPPTLHCCVQQAEHHTVSLLDTACQ